MATYRYDPGKKRNEALKTVAVTTTQKPANIPGVKEIEQIKPEDMKAQRGEAEKSTKTFKPSDLTDFKPEKTKFISEEMKPKASKGWFGRDKDKNKK